MGFSGAQSRRPLVYLCRALAGSVQARRRSAGGFGSYPRLGPGIRHAGRFRSPRYSRLIARPSTAGAAHFGIGKFSGFRHWLQNVEDLRALATACSRGRGVIEHYRDYLPVSGSTPIVSLGEGATPLIYSPRASAIVGRECEVHIKCEGLNPTCSFKDRGMTVAVSKAVEHGATAVICASTGNTSASAAAYAARAGIRCAVVLPAGKIASGKLS